MFIEFLLEARLCMRQQDTATIAFQILALKSLPSWKANTYASGSKAVLYKLKQSTVSSGHKDRSHENSFSSWEVLWPGKIAPDMSFSSAFKMSLVWHLTHYPHDVTQRDLLPEVSLGHFTPGEQKSVGVSTWKSAS